MRLWSLHPSYLDAKGIVALWREALLAQAVLAGRTAGYLRHPQLERFRAAADPQLAIAAYLEGVLAEARRRGYSFDAGRIGGPRRLSRGRQADEAGSGAPPIEVTAGQLRYERHLLAVKLARRKAAGLSSLIGAREPLPHPLFRRIPGVAASWERVKELPPIDLPAGGPTML